MFPTSLRPLTILPSLNIAAVQWTAAILGPVQHNKAHFDKIKNYNNIIDIMEHNINLLLGCRD